MQEDRKMIETSNEISNIEAAWDIDPATIARLWPVIDVYGRISRALRAQGTVVALEGRLAGNGSAA